MQALSAWPPGQITEVGPDFSLKTDFWYVLKWRYIFRWNWIYFSKNTNKNKWIFL